MIYYVNISFVGWFDCNFYVFHIQVLANKLKYSLGQSGTVDGGNADSLGQSGIVDGGDAEVAGDSASISESSISSAMDDDGY